MRGGREEEGQGRGRNGQIKGRCWKAFSVDLADVCWKWVHENVKPTCKTEPLFYLFIFNFLNPGTLSKEFRIFTLYTEAHWPFLAVCQRVSLLVTLYPIEVQRRFALRPHVALLQGSIPFLWCRLEFGQLLNCRMLSQVLCTGYQRILWWHSGAGTMTPSGIYFMCKLGFLFWFRCLLDWGYTWYSNLSLYLMIAETLWSQGFIRVFAVSFWFICIFTLLHKCEFIRIDYKKYTI